MDDVNVAYRFPASELSTLLRKAPTLTGAYNTGYTVRFAHPNRLSPTSYSPKPLYAIGLKEENKNG